MEVLGNLAPLRNKIMFPSNSLAQVPYDAIFSHVDLSAVLHFFFKNRTKTFFSSFK